MIFKFPPFCYGHSHMSPPKFSRGFLRLNGVRFSYRITNCEENEQRQNQYTVFWFFTAAKLHNTNQFVLQFAISPERTCTIRKEG